MKKITIEEPKRLDFRLLDEEAGGFTIGSDTKDRSPAKCPAERFYVQTTTPNYFKSRIDSWFLANTASLHDHVLPVFLMVKVNTWVFDMLRSLDSATGSESRDRDDNVLIYGVVPVKSMFSFFFLPPLIPFFLHRGMAISAWRKSPIDSSMYIHLWQSYGK